MPFHFKVMTSKDPHQDILSDNLGSYVQKYTEHKKKTLVLHDSNLVIHSTLRNQLLKWNHYQTEFCQIDLKQKDALGHIFVCQKQQF